MARPRRKPLVFISHITAEADLARWLKEVLEAHFSGKVEFFVSSDSVSIRAGQRWLEGVSDALHRCAIQIVICSPASLSRPWVNFEAGAGWVREIPVVPVCHSGLLPGELPVPLNMLKAAVATDAAALQSVVRILAEAIDSDVPAVDFGDFIKNVRAFESAPIRVRGFYDAARDIQSDLADLVASTKQRILTAGVHFNICLSDRRREYLRALASGVDVTIAMLDPQCEALETTARAFQMESAELRSECETGLQIMRAFRQQYEREKSSSAGFGRLTLLIGRQTPRARYYVFDDQLPAGYVLFTPYVQGLRSSLSPTYGLPASEAAAQKYVKCCEDVIAQADPLN